MNSLIRPAESEPPLRVVHVGSDVSRGGASTAMRRLHEGLLRHGVKSTVVTLQTTEPTPDVELVGSPRIEAQRQLLDFVHRFIHQQRTPISNTFFSPDVAVTAALDLSPELRSADIIHLHWVAGFLSSRSLLDLVALGKPVFWTLHDLRPLSGGCHFPAGCEQFTTRCAVCPQLQSDPLQMTERGQEALRRAAAALKIHYVAPSSWLERCAQRSTIAAHETISLVPYGLDAVHFSPMDKKTARARLGLRTDACYILLGAQNFEEIRKGAGAARTILQLLAAQPKLRSKISNGTLRLACFGAVSDELEIPDWPIDRLGYLENHDRLRAAYSGSDVLLFTSHEDNLPNVVLEAMACELPVIGFSVGGIPDLVTDGENGLLLHPLELPEAAARIAELLDRPNKLGEWSKSARRKILEKFTLDHQSERMLRLYQEAIAGGHSAENSRCHVVPDDTFLQFEEVVQLAAAGAQQQIISVEGRLERLKQFLKQCRREPWKLYGKRPSP